MNRVCLVLLLTIATSLFSPPLWSPAISEARAEDTTAKEAFEAAKQLDTREGWQTFLESYPSGFYANLARAYLKKLDGTAPGAAASDKKEPEPASKPAQATGTQPDAPDAQLESPAGKAEAPDGKVEAELPAAADTSIGGTLPGKPAVARGGKYMGFSEKFNRYYTDPTWKPTKTIYVSPDGSGDGTSRDSPMAAADAVAAARPGTKIYFLRGSYQGCFEFGKENSGTYDAPIVLYAERSADKKTLGVKLTCCKSGRQTCFNLEGADYVALDGFELIGGKYGVRAIGLGFPASEHSLGVAVLHCKGHDQDRDPFFSGATDWTAWEGNLAYGAKKEDGHGMYLSNGGDWNVVRFNETYGNASSDFQINPDPASTCKEAGIEFTDPRCHDYAGTGEGGQGASDYFLVDGNYFHHDLSNGPNFTSMRRSVVRNNIFGPQARHNVSFWQETDNPQLGSSDNKILHNLFITTDKHAVQFSSSSTRNEFANNVILGIKTDGGQATANPKALLMEVDDTVGDNVYRNNLYVSGKMEGRTPGDEETAQAEFAPGWFAKFPAGLNHDPVDFTPTPEAPFLGAGTLSPDAPLDRSGKQRPAKVDLGPIEVD